MMNEMPTLSNVASDSELKQIRLPQNNTNMAYVNISSEGAKLVGPIGLKKAEKELIMRRYKYNHQIPNDNLNRMAVI